MNLSVIISMFRSPMKGVLVNPYFYLLLMSVIFLVSFTYFIIKISKIKGVLKKIKNLKTKNLSDLLKIFKDNKYDNIVNDIEANTIFNKDKKISIKNFEKIMDVEKLLITRVNINFLDNLPQLFLTIGILGTFIGISYGFSSLENVDFSNTHLSTSKISKDISNLLTGIKTSFISSIIGMSFSIVTNFILDFLNKNIEDKIRVSANEMNSYFYQSSAEKEMINKIKEDLSLTLETVLTTKISELLEENLEIVETLSDKLKIQSNEVKNSAELFIEKMNTLDEVFRSSFKTTISELFNETFINKIKNIQNQLEDRFDSSDKNLEAFNEYMMKTVSKMSTMHENFDTFNESLKNNIDEFKNVDLLQHIEKVNTETKETALIFKKFNKEINESFSPIAEKSNSIINNVKKLNYDLEGVVKENTQTLQNFSENLLKLDIKPLTNSVEDLEENIAIINESIGDIKMVNQEIIDTNKDIHKEFKVLSVKNYLGEYKEIMEQIEVLKESFEEINNHIDKRMSHFEKNDIFSYINDIDGGIEELSINFKKINNNLIEVKNKTIKLHGDFDDIKKNGEDVLELHEEILESSKETKDQLLKDDELLKNLSAKNLRERREG